MAPRKTHPTSGTGQQKPKAPKGGSKGGRGKKTGKGNN